MSYIKLNIKYYIIIYILILLLPVSCRKILFSDAERTRRIFPGDFNTVIVKGIFNILLVQDSTNMVVIRGTNRMNLVDIVASNDTLVIKDNNKFPLEPGRNTLELHFTGISYLEANDPAEIRCHDTIRAEMFNCTLLGEIVEADVLINCDYLVVYGSHSSLGHTDVSGKCRFADLSVRYGASIDASALHCRESEIYSGSAGNVYVNAAEKVKAHITGPGNIYCYGNPAIELAGNTGSGKIIFIGN